jgi:hypothetical protein
LSQSSNLLWRIAVCSPLVFIVWHIYIAVTQGPGQFAFLWGLEACWIITYVLALAALIHPTPSGFLYLVFLISANLAQVAR